MQDSHMHMNWMRRNIIEFHTSGASWSCVCRMDFPTLGLSSIGCGTKTSARYEFRMSIEEKVKSRMSSIVGSAELGNYQATNGTQCYPAA